MIFGFVIGRLLDSGCERLKGVGDAFECAGDPSECADCPLDIAYLATSTRWLSIGNLPKRE
jgi:hypothetical protein